MGKGHLGFNSEIGELLKGKGDGFWDKVYYWHHNQKCLLGCSIQPDPKKSKTGGGVEASVGQGLKQRHAYSLLGLNEITGLTVDGKTDETVRLVRVRNPWGFGEWTGRWSDDSPEFNDPNNLKQITEQGNWGDDGEKVESNSKDGAFFMSFDDWRKYYTHLFAVRDFPDEYSGWRLTGEWSPDTAGGNNKRKTWASNPRFNFEVRGGGWVGGRWGGPVALDLPSL